MNRERIRKAIHEALAVKKPATEKDLDNLHELDDDLKSVFYSIVGYELNKIKLEERLNDVVVVTTGARTLEDFAEQCACVGKRAKATSGASGSVSVGKLSLCGGLREAGFVPEKGRSYAVKIQSLQFPTTSGRLDGIPSTDEPNIAAVRSWKREASIAREAGELGVGPTVHTSFVCKGNSSVTGVGVIVMDALHKQVSKMSSRSRSRAKEQLPALLQRLHDAGIVHGDAHVGNMMVDKAGTAFVVDYGFAVRVDDMKKSDLDDVERLTDGREEIDADRALPMIVARLYSKGVIR